MTFAAKVQIALAHTRSFVALIVCCTHRSDRIRSRILMCVRSKKIMTVLEDRFFSL
jgi:hypothetical protein